MFSRISAFAALLPIATVASAAEPLPRQPTGKWVVDFHASQCVASREYGTPANPLILALKAPPLGNVIELALLRPGKADRYAQQVQGHFGIGAGQPMPMSMLVFSAGEPPMRLVRVTLPVEQLRLAETAESIHVSANGELDERLALNQLGSVLKVMDECVDDLRKVWNVVEGEDQQTALQERATGDLRGVFRGNDYPDVALQNNQQGNVQFALLIDEEGRVADCTVLETSGVATLDAQACAIIKQRAKFKPGTGAGGEPAKDALVQRVRWKLAR